MSEETRYKAEEAPVEKWYRNLLNTRWETAKALNHLRAYEKNAQATDDIQQEISNKKQLEINFLTRLDQYYDLVEYKFGKNGVEKPGFIEEKEKHLDEWETINIQDLELDKAIYLYKQINRLLEELKITSIEKEQFQRRKV